MKKVRYFIFFLTVFGCVEPYNFIIKNEAKILVIEGFISDKSYDDTKLYPTDGRFFSIRLSYTGDVTNKRPDMISGALVTLMDDQSNQWSYQESINETGVYYLRDEIFKGEKGVKYKIMVTLPNEDMYESEWEMMPATDVPEMGEISFRETQMEKYEIIAREKVISTVKGITTQINVPTNTTDNEIYYRWKFNPTWIFNASLTVTSSPVHKCWVNGNTYLTNYGLQIDKTGGYKKDLFFLETIRNDRIYEEFSVLVTQFACSENSYNFWREMQDMVQLGTFKDTPPFNLQTNFHSVGDDKTVIGYFSVVQEQAKRWYFTKTELSYFVEDDLKSSCLADPKVRPEECFDCRAYAFGISSNVKPSWWHD